MVTLTTTRRVLQTQFPTGTISFMMDCDTTGIEPDIALVKYKKLVGGGLLKIVNQTVPEALKKLGYSPVTAQQIVEHIDKNDNNLCPR
jgi:ribonucleoside-diphosphate reductase alpha chain